MKLTILKKCFQERPALAKSLAFFLLIFAANVCSASSLTLGTISSNIYGSFYDLTKLITSSSYVAGLGFAIGSIMKFKAHKDNPTQISVGVPIGLLCVAAALLYLPSILGSAGQTLFGDTGSVAGPTGQIFAT